MRHKPDRLVVIARIHNNLISAETDATIARSGTFKITEPSTYIDFFPPQAFVDRLIKGSEMVDVFIFEVPEDFPIESVKTIRDAEQRGAKQLADKAFGLVHLPPLMQPSSPP